jgi:hypothetical protein
VHTYNPSTRRLRYCEFEASQGCTGRPCLLPTASKGLRLQACKKPKTVHFLDLDSNLICIKEVLMGQVLVAHACNPSYSGGRDQEVEVQS